jgi:hypothetical protein
MTNQAKVTWCTCEKTCPIHSTPEGRSPEIAMALRLVETREALETLLVATTMAGPVLKEAIVRAQQVLEKTK